MSGFSKYHEFLNSPKQITAIYFPFSHRRSRQKAGADAGFGRIPLYSRSNRLSALYPSRTHQPIILAH
jgi:hypothetical protein